MAQIPNKLLYFSQGSSYRTKREDEEIRDDSIVFVEDDASIVARQNIFGVRGVYPGTCTTAAGTAAKVATTSPLFPLNSNGKPLPGTTIAIKFSNTNTYKTAGTTMTLNVNSTGAYPIYYNNAEVVSTTSANTVACGYKDRYTYYIFNGTQWVWLSYGTDANTTYSNAALGQGYAIQDNESESDTVTATLSSYALTTGGIVVVKFIFDVPCVSGPTLNINAKGAKAIYHNGSPLKPGIIKSGDLATFIYSTNYYLISLDRDFNDPVNVGTLNTNNSTAQSVNSSESLSGNINLHKISKTGSYDDLLNKPTIPTVDASLTSSSQTNPVQGGAIYSALEGKEDRQVVRLNFEYNQNTGVITFTDSDGNSLTHSEVRLLLNNISKDVRLFDTASDVTLFDMSITKGWGDEDEWGFSSLGGQAVWHIGLWWRDNSITVTNYSDVNVMSTLHPANAITSAKISQWDNKPNTDTQQVVIQFNETDDPLEFTDINDNTITHAQFADLCNDTSKTVLLRDNDNDVLFRYGGFYDDSNYWTFLNTWSKGTTRITLQRTNGVISINSYHSYDFDDMYQYKLVSGTDIKTINSQSLLGSGNLTLSQLGIPDALKSGSVAGKLYRNNVGGSGNFSISGNSGCIPNLTAGTFIVSIYAKSTTQSYTFRFNFGSISYDLSTTNGEINDVREITIPSDGTFSGSVLNGSVASGTILYVVMYNYLTPVSTVGVAAVTNRYSDLDGTPTIPTVPTNISSFTNDVGYITSTAITNLTDIL